VRELHQDAVDHLFLSIAMVFMAFGHWKVTIMYRYHSFGINKQKTRSGQRKSYFNSSVLYGSTVRYHDSNTPPTPLSQYTGRRCPLSSLQIHARPLFFFVLFMRPLCWQWRSRISMLVAELQQSCSSGRDGGYEIQ
jgi:hypothetical protein